MNAAGYAMGQLIGLALIPAAVIWALRGTRPGRVVWRAVADYLAWRRARRAHASHTAAAHAYEQWAANMAWWGAYRSQHAPGSAQYELAATVIANLEMQRPAYPYWCPATGFTCTTPRCPQHPRSHQS